MTIDERIRYLLRAAARAEEEGNVRLAELFRRMADDARTAEPAPPPSPLPPSMGCCPG